MAILKLFAPQKLIWSLADIAEHIAKSKEDLIETFLLNALTSIFLLVAAVTEGL